MDTGLIRVQELVMVLEISILQSMVAKGVVVQATGTDQLIKVHQMTISVFQKKVTT